MDIDEVLAKPGSEWTKEEALLVRQVIKTHGRAALKSKRLDLLKKAVDNSNVHSRVALVATIKEKILERRRSEILAGTDPKNGA